MDKEKLKQVTLDLLHGRYDIVIEATRDYSLEAGPFGRTISYNFEQDARECALNLGYTEEDISNSLSELLQHRKHLADEYERERKRWAEVCNAQQKAQWEVIEESREDWIKRRYEEMEEDRLFKETWNPRPQ